jgi:membrane protease YdiL (CAAX protease family)
MNEHDRRPRRAVAEMAAVFLAAFAIVAIGWRIVGDGTFARQVVVWIANVAMLTAIGISLRRRGQTPSRIGLRRPRGRRAIAFALVASIPVLLVALAAFVAGGALFSNGAAGQAADMGDYDWLRGNIGMLVVALPAVWFVSSFGEEVVYRGFIMDRTAEALGGGRLAWAAAAVISAIIFGLAHFAWGIVGIVQTVFMGLALSLSFLAFRRSLWPLVLAHVWIDTILLVQVYAGSI